VLAFHGAGGSASNFIRIWTEVAEREGFLVIAQQSVGVGWGTSVDVPPLNAIIDDVFAHFDADESRIYATGFSAGAHFTYWLAFSNPEAFAAIGVQAGSMSSVLSNTGWSDGISYRFPLDIHHGRSDSVVPFAHATVARDQLEAAGHTVHFEPFEGGHTTNANHAEQIWSNLSSARRP